MPRLSLLLAVCAAAGRALASCAYGTHLHPRQADGSVPVGTFGYKGTNNPLNWLALDPAANVACATGTRQSPIDMTEGQFALVPAADLQLTLPDLPETELENLGTTAEVVVPAAAGAGLVANGTSFALQQFHFHLPSEHLDNGRKFAMEMHMVFQSANQEIAVLGVYVDTANGAETPVAAAAAAPAEAVAAPAPAPAPAARRHARDTAAVRPRDAQSVVSALLGLLGGAAAAGTGSTTEAAAAEGATAAASPVSRAVGVATGATGLFDAVFAAADRVATPGTKTAVGPLVLSGLAQSLAAGPLQAYAGSLTTPPCSEGVRWFVSTQKQTISLSAFDAASRVLGFNSRFPQNALGQPNVLALAVTANSAAVNGAVAAAAAAAAA